MDTHSNDVCANLLTDCRRGYCRTNTTSSITSEPCSDNNDNGDSVDMR